MTRLTTIASLLTLALTLAEAPGVSPVEQIKNGNFQNALPKFKKLLANPETTPRQRIDSYDGVLQCYHRLNRVDEIDAFREQLAKDHADDWRLLAAIARSWMEQPHFGHQIAGEFRRGSHRGGGKVVNATARDRVRALRLYRAAFELVRKRLEERKSAPAVEMMTGFAEALMSGKNYGQSWRLQSLTDVSKLPDYADG